MAIPSLLFNREQVSRLVDDLEVRFLGNHDPNIYFALLTDLPDTSEPSNEEDPLIALLRAIDTRTERKIFRAGGRDHFCCSIAIGFTTRAKEFGWVGSASAAS